MPRFWQEYFSPSISFNQIVIFFQFTKAEIAYIIPQITCHRSREHYREVEMRITRRLGTLLLAIFLILYGLVALFHVNFTGMDIIMGILALAAGILILLER